MKLATLKDGSRDGMLAVVSRDQKTAHLADGIAPTLQRALDDWNFIAPQLEDLSIALNSGRAKRSFEFVPANCMAPLPRSHQWADGSVYEQHVELLTRAFQGKLPENLWREPMMYQGGSDDFLGPCDAPVFAEEHWGIDFEPELGVVLGDTPMQVKKEDALEHVRLLVLINDWSLRNLIAPELAKGFGFFHSKPATAFAPLAVMPDELGEAWRDGLARLGVAVDWNGVRFMSANAGVGTRFSFTDLIVHAAKTRNLRAGTIIGSGTVSSEGNVGCIAELRARESLEEGGGGKPRTAYMKFDDRVRIDAFDTHGHSMFGAIEQQVASLRRRRAATAAAEAAAQEANAAAATAATAQARADAEAQEAAEAAPEAAAQAAPEVAPQAAHEASPQVEKAPPATEAAAAVAELSAPADVTEGVASDAPASDAASPAESGGPESPASGPRCRAVSTGGVA